MRKFGTDEACRAHLESVRWPDGPVCDRCGTINDAIPVEGRAGFWRCRPCGKQFSVTAGTPMHGTHLPLHVWYLAMYLILASSKGTGVHLVAPAARRARKPVPSEEPRAAEEVLADLTWRRVTWRHGTKGPLAIRFAAIRVRVADGDTWANNRHLPGAEVWLVGEWRPSGERKYHLSNLPPRTSLRALVAAIKARWVCEQAHRQLKGELGLGHFEGRSWTGLHRHALMTCIAFAWLQSLRLAAQRRTEAGKNPTSGSGAATIADPARRAPRRHRAAVRTPRRVSPMSPLPQAFPAAG